MNARPDIPDHDDPAWGQGVLQRHVSLLERLAEEGLRLAQVITAQAAEGSAADAAMAFSRVARAIRMTGLLQAKLIKDMQDLRRRAESLGDPLASRDPLHVHKARVERIVDRLAHAHTGDEDEIDSLVLEAGDRLDDEDLYGDILQKPIGELVALICKDLGLDPDWASLAQEHWAIEEIESGAEGSPFLANARPPPLAGEGDHEVVERALRPTTPTPAHACQGLTEGPRPSG